jgi:hypothetical protein
MTRPRAVRPRRHEVGADFQAGVPLSRRRTVGTAVFATDNRGIAPSGSGSIVLDSRPTGGDTCGVPRAPDVREHRFVPFQSQAPLREAPAARGGSGAGAAG